MRRRRATGAGSTAPASSGTAGTLPTTSIPRKRRVAGTSTTADSTGETRRLKRRPRNLSARGGGGAGAEGAPGVKALVVKDDMELADMMALVTDVLERLSETERELRRLRKEGSLVKPNRVSKRGGVVLIGFLQRGPQL